MYIYERGFYKKPYNRTKIKKGISEYKMSTDMGHSKSYIQSITSGRALPSLSEFIYMCEYLGVTPKEFFDENITEPILVRQLCNLVSNLPDKDLLTLINIADRLNEKKNWNVTFFKKATFQFDF